MRKGKPFVGRRGLEEYLHSLDARQERVADNKAHQSHGKAMVRGKNRRHRK